MSFLLTITLKSGHFFSSEDMKKGSKEKQDELHLFCNDIEGSVKTILMILDICLRKTLLNLNHHRESS
jgi:hypothetical protein